MKNSWLADMPQISQLWDELGDSANPADRHACTRYSLASLSAMTRQQLGQLAENAQRLGALHFSTVCRLLAQRAQWAALLPEAANEGTPDPREAACRAYWLEGMAAFREAGRLDGHPMAGQRTAPMPQRHGYHEAIRLLATRDVGRGGYDGFEAMVRHGMVKLTAEWFVGVDRPDLFDTRDVVKARLRLTAIGALPANVEDGET